MTFFLLLSKTIIKTTPKIRFEEPLQRTHFFQPHECNLLRKNNRFIVIMHTWKIEIF